MTSARRAEAFLLQGFVFVLKPAVIYEALVDLCDLSGFAPEDTDSVARAVVVCVSLNGHEATAGCLHDHARMSKPSAQTQYEQRARLYEPRVGDRTCACYAQDTWFSARLIPVIQDSGGLDMRILKSQRLGGLEVAEMRKGHAPGKALADGIKP